MVHYSQCYVFTWYINRKWICYTVDFFWLIIIIGYLVSVLYTLMCLLLVEREMELCIKDCILTSTEQKPSFSRLVHAARCSKSL